MTSIFTPDQVVKYAETRYFTRLDDSKIDLKPDHVIIRPEDVETIELHNGKLESVLRDEVLKRTGTVKYVIQPNGREQIFYSKGTLFVPQFSGVSRENRYIEMAKAYLDASRKRMWFEKHYPNNDPAEAVHKYSDNAHDFIVGSFVRLDKHEDRRVFENDTVADIDTIIFGHMKSFASMSEVLKTGRSEYLKAQILNIDGKRAFNIGDVYGDQANMLTSKWLLEQYSMAKRDGKRKDLWIYVTGRAAGLLDSMERHDIICPNWIINNHHLKQGNNHPRYPINNMLAPTDRDIYSLHVDSVINETIEELEEARKNNVVGVEMELLHFMLAIIEAEATYSDYLNINVGFVYHVSDLPLKVRDNGQRDTLADELDSDKGERETVKMILSNIKHRQ
jgi:hypothetical protein